MIALTPILFAAGLVAHYAVDIPRMDELEIGMVLYHLDAGGHLTIHGLLNQSNESRMVFPKLISVGIAALTDWDTRWTMGLTMVLMLANLLMLHRLYRRFHTGVNSTDPTPMASILVFFGMALMIFTPFQAELVWGFQYLTHIPMFCILAGSLLAVSSLRAWLNHPLAILLCIIATFSYANGMISWGLVGCVFVLTGQFRGRRMLWGLAWAAIGAGALWLYWHGYRKPAYHPSFTAFRGQEWAAFRGLLSFIGAPLGLELRGYGERVSLPTAAGAGAVVLAIWTALLGGLVRRYRKDGLSHAAPWIAVLGYTVGSGLVTTLGRIGFGPGAMMSARYAGFSTYTLAGTVAICAVALHANFVGAGRVRLCRWAAVALGIATVGVYAVNLDHHLTQLRQIHEGCRYIRAALPFAEQMNPAPAIEGFFINGSMCKVTRRLRELGDIRPAAVTAETYEQGTQRMHGGVLEGIQASAHRYTASGWAALPRPRRRADAVVITVRTPGSTPRIPIAIARPDHLRPDVVAAVGRPAAEASGWQVEFPAPAPGQELEAWAVDANDCSLYRLRLSRPSAAPATQP